MSGDAGGDLHPHVIKQGFLDYVRTKKGDEPLFYSAKRTTSKHPQRTVGDDLGEWVRGLGVTDPKVQPNHGWRHRLKTVGRDCGMDLVVLDAIQGHAPRTEGERYGSFSWKTMLREIMKIPEYVVEPVESVDRRRREVKGRMTGEMKQSDTCGHAIPLQICLDVDVLIFAVVHKIGIGEIAPPAMPDAFEEVLDYQADDD